MPNFREECNYYMVQWEVKRYCYLRCGPGGRSASIWGFGGLVPAALGVALYLSFPVYFVYCIYSFAPVFRGVLLKMIENAVQYKKMNVRAIDVTISLPSTCGGAH